MASLAQKQTNEPKNTTSLKKNGEPAKTDQQADTEQLALERAPTNGATNRLLQTGSQSIPDAGSLGIQAKLVIGEPGDKYEQEADRMAEQVMTMAKNPAAAPPPNEENNPGMLQAKPLHISSIQRKCTSCEKEEERLQAKSNGDLNATANLQAQLQVSKGCGFSLPESTNQSMSQVFGRDFSDVRIHTDSDAVQMNQSLNARAFTHGNNIYFNKGQYNPDTSAGTKLLAHELTHTVQQTNHDLIQRTQNQTPKRQESIRIEWKGSLESSLESFALNYVDEIEAKRITQIILNDPDAKHITPQGAVNREKFEKGANESKIKSFNLHVSADFFKALNITLVYNSKNPNQPSSYGVIVIIQKQEDWVNTFVDRVNERIDKKYSEYKPGNITIVGKVSKKRHRIHIYKFAPNKNNRHHGPYKVVDIPNWFSRIVNKDKEIDKFIEKEIINPDYEHNVNGAPLSPEDKRVGGSSESGSSSGSKISSEGGGTTEIDEGKTDIATTGSNDFDMSKDELITSFLKEKYKPKAKRAKHHIHLNRLKEIASSFHWSKRFSREEVTILLKNCTPEEQELLNTTESETRINLFRRMSSYHIARGIEDYDMQLQTKLFWISDSKKGIIYRDLRRLLVKHKEHQELLDFFDAHILLSTYLSRPEAIFSYKDPKDYLFYVEKIRDTSKRFDHKKHVSTLLHDYMLEEENINLPENLKKLIEIDQLNNELDSLHSELRSNRTYSVFGNKKTKRIREKIKQKLKSAGYNSMSEFKKDLSAQKKLYLIEFELNAVKKAYQLLDESEKAVLQQSDKLLLGTEKDIVSLLEENSGKFAEIEAIEFKYKKDKKSIHNSVRSWQQKQIAYSKIRTRRDKIIKEKKDNLKNELGKKQPLLYHPPLDIVDLYNRYAFNDANDSDKKLKILIKKDLEEKFSNIDEVRKKLEQNPDFIWKLPTLIETTKKDMNQFFNIKLLNDVVDQENSRRKFRDALAITGEVLIVLGLAFMTGGALAPVALVVGAGIGFNDVVRSINEYHEDKITGNTAIFPKNVLNEADPNLLWVALSLAGLGLDVGSFGKFLKPLSKLDEIGDIGKMHQKVDSIADDIERAGLFKTGTSAKVTKSAFKTHIKKSLEVIRSLALDVYIKLEELGYSFGIESKRFMSIIKRIFSRNIIKQAEEPAYALAGSSKISVTDEILGETIGELVKAKSFNDYSSPVISILADSDQKVFGNIIKKLNTPELSHVSKKLLLKLNLLNEGDIKKSLRIIDRLLKEVDDKKDLIIYFEYVASISGKFKKPIYERLVYIARILNSKHIPIETKRVIGAKLRNPTHIFDEDHLDWILEYLPKLHEESKQRVLDNLSSPDKPFHNFYKKVTDKQEVKSPEEVEEIIKNISSKEKVTISERFKGTNFESLSNHDKILEVVRTTEPELVMGIKEAEDGAFIKQLLEDMSINPKYQVNSSNLLETERGKLLKYIIEKIGSQVTTLNDYKKMLEIYETQGSVGALGESFMKNIDVPPGAKEGNRKSIQMRHVNGMEDHTRIIDNFLYRNGDINESKVGTSMNWDQFRDYITMLMRGEIVQKGERIPLNQLNYTFSPGLNDFKKMEKALKAGKKIEDPVLKRVEAHWYKVRQTVSNSSIIDRISFYVLTTNGEVYRISNKGKELVKVVK